MFRAVPNGIETNRKDNGKAPYKLLLKDVEGSDKKGFPNSFNMFFVFPGNLSGVAPLWAMRQHGGA